MPTENGDYPRKHVRALAGRRSRHDRNSHHGVKSELLRTLVAVSKRKNGGFWNAQFCAEVAATVRSRTTSRALGDIAAAQVRLIVHYSHCIGHSVL
jgi:hypothetical protein